MKVNLKRSIAGTLVVCMLASIPSTAVYGDTGTNTPTKTYTLSSAIERAIHSSLLMQQLDYKDKLAATKVDSYDEISNSLLSGEQTVNSGIGSINQASTVLGLNQSAINQAKIDIASGKLPSLVPSITVPGITPALTIKAGENIATVVTKYNTDNSTSLPVDTIVAQVTTQVNATILAAQKQLDEKQTAYDQNLVTLESGNMDYKIGKAKIAASLADKLDISELNGLSAGSSTRILRKMANVSAELTKISKSIYRNQIAMLIESNYYNALKAKKIMEMKQVSQKRALNQYEFAKDGFETGMKAKDDMLLAEIYYTSTTMELQKSMTDYDNALIELKKNMNIPMDSDIELEDVTMNNFQPYSLKSGIDSAMEKRLEVLKVMRQEDIYILNKDLVDEVYAKGSKRCDEAEYLRQNAKLEVDRTKSDVECGIRQSFNNMTMLSDLLKTSNKMVAEAKDCLDIAKMRYEAGYGADSALMKKLDLEASNGTILEVISAEENYVQIQEKYIELLYNYNLAKTKYLNDIAYLTY